MSFFKKQIRNPLVIEIAAPDSVTWDDVFLNIEIGLSCETKVIKPVVKARLRADITDKKKARGKSQYYVLGETEYQGAVEVVPGHPEKLTVRIPLDFSPMNSFEIPSENMAMASPELQAAMAAAQEVNQLYVYSVEVIVKTVEHEYIQRKPIELINPDSTRVADF
jgi:hypothetical protein